MPLAHHAAPLDDVAPTPEESAGFEAVRDSWVDAPPAADVHRTEPPALPPSIRESPDTRPSRAEPFADRMFDRLAAGDYAGALIAAEALLRLVPRDADALDCAEMSRGELRKVYEARLGGSLDRVPSIAMAPADIAAVVHDVYSGFLLSRVDGLTSLREIVSARGMAPEQALRVISELHLQGVITLD